MFQLYFGTVSRESRSVLSDERGLQYAIRDVTCENRAV